MSRIFKDRLSTGVTPVADAFIDNYMAAANGEYVKVIFTFFAIKTRKI